MTYDLLIKNGTIVDGTGAPQYQGDLAIADGKIVQIGDVQGDAKRVIDATGHLVLPGFIDNHCHFDGQVTFDPLCTFSSYNGVTTVINGNCSLTLAPLRKGDEHMIAQMLSKVEAIPLDVLENGVKWGWETFAEYLDVVEENLGVNVGALVGHSALRRYVMGDASQEREATGTEIEEMQSVLRDSLEAGAIGVSFDRNPRHVDTTGKLLPGNVASREEILALASEMKTIGRGAIEVGDPTHLELQNGFCGEVAEAAGRPVIYTSIVQNVLDPEQWKEHLAHAAENQAKGIQAYPLINPRPGLRFFQMDSAEFFNFLPTWKEIMATPHAQRIERFSDRSIRPTLDDEVHNGINKTALGFSGRWDLVEVISPVLESNAGLAGKSITTIAEEQGKEPLDAFLDLVVEEKLKTWFARNQQNNDDEAMAEILNSPNTVVGLSDAGAHVVREGGYGLSVYFLSHWVRDKQVMGLEAGVRQLTGFQAELFGINDRGRLQPGLAADVLVMDYEGLGLDEAEEAHDLPGGSMRLKQLAHGIPFTIVNGEVLIENGEHTGAVPGKVLRGNDQG
jgi:N-acyl-D-aspartate/D-glutamate deacylase